MKIIPENLPFLPCVTSKPWNTGRYEWYCWWKKSCTSWYDWYPIIFRVLTIPGGAGFCPWTVWMVWIPKNEGFRICLGKETETQESENCLFVCLALFGCWKTHRDMFTKYIYILYFISQHILYIGLVVISQVILFIDMFISFPSTWNGWHWLCRDFRCVLVVCLS